MGALVVQVGSQSVQGKRASNEDRYVADPHRQVFLVADGMGGQTQGEVASGMAAEILPRLLHDELARQDNASQAVAQALAQANEAILHASQEQAFGRRMGTTAVVAVQQAEQMYVAGLGDSRAYLIRGDQVEQLTVDHTIADALQRSGCLSAEEARRSPWRNMLYRFLGCAEMTEGAEVHPFTPLAGDRLLLASDGLTQFVSVEDLRQGARHYPDPQQWAEALVQMALERGSGDNVTCVIVAFDSTPPRA